MDDGFKVCIPSGNAAPHRTYRRVVHKWMDYSRRLSAMTAAIIVQTIINFLHTIHLLSWDHAAHVRVRVLVPASWAGMLDRAVPHPQLIIALLITHPRTEGFRIITEPSSTGQQRRLQAQMSVFRNPAVWHDRNR